MIKNIIYIEYLLKLIIMENIPTAEDFLLHDYDASSRQEGGSVFAQDAKDKMIEFAKLHVKAALQEALENVPGFGSSTDIPDWKEVEKELLNSYPLENIK